MKTTHQNHFRPHLWTVLLIVLLICGSGKCTQPESPIGPRIALPVCACILRGTAWTADPNRPANASKQDDNYYTYNESRHIGDLVNSVIDSAVNNVWIPGAQIAMVPQIDFNGSIPVIDYPNVWGGPRGDVPGYPGEGEEVAGKCRAAWGNQIVQDGLVIIFVHNIINRDGSPQGRAGYSEPYDAVLQRNNGADLCSYPRNISKNDVKGKYMIIEDPTLDGFTSINHAGQSFVFVAHEFGHVLMLGHGDGLDNDGNGQVPPNAGLRKFDDYCDVPEYNLFDGPHDAAGVGPGSIMNATNDGGFLNLTPLQVECARTVASLIPGERGP